MPNLRVDRLNKLAEVVRTLPPDALYFWRWKMEKAEFQSFGHKTEPRAALEFNVNTTVANPGVWFALLSRATDRESFTLEIRGDQVQPSYGGALGHDALAAFFGLTQDEEAFVFKGEAYFGPKIGDDPPAMVHPRIETVLEHIEKVIDGRRKSGKL